MTDFRTFSHNLAKGIGLQCTGLMRRSRLSLLIGLLTLGLWSGQAVWAANFETILIRLGYNHTKYAPKPEENDIVRRFAAYTTCFDGEDDDDGDGTPDKWAIPHWVAYEIKRYPGQLPDPPKHPSTWITDRTLFTQGIAPRDDSYHYSENRQRESPKSLQLGFDRGFMCMRLHALRLGEDAYWNAHTLLNACPQKSKLSRGIWLDLGRKIADWADDFGSLWIITGPVIYNNKPLMWLGQKGEVPVAIPDAFFKIVARIRDGRPQVLAFIYPQEGIAYKRTGGYDHTPYLTSVDVIEALTGLDFFSEVPDHVESEIERVVQIRLWD